MNVETQDIKVIIKKLIDENKLTIDDIINIVDTDPDVDIPYCIELLLLTNDVPKLIELTLKCKKPVIYKSILLLFKVRDIDNYLKKIIVLIRKVEAAHIHICLEGLININKIEKYTELILDISKRTPILYIENTIKLLLKLKYIENYIPNIITINNKSKNHPQFYKNLKHISKINNIENYTKLLIDTFMEENVDYGVYVLGILGDLKNIKEYSTYIIEKATLYSYSPIINKCISILGSYEFIPQLINLYQSTVCNNKVGCYDTLSKLPNIENYIKEMVDIFYNETYNCTQYLQILINIKNVENYIEGILNHIRNSRGILISNQINLILCMLNIKNTKYIYKIIEFARDIDVIDISIINKINSINNIGKSDLYKIINIFRSMYKDPIKSYENLSGLFFKYYKVNNYLELFKTIDSEHINKTTIENIYNSSSNIQDINQVQKSISLETLHKLRLKLLINNISDYAIEELNLILEKELQGRLYVLLSIGIYDSKYYTDFKFDGNLINIIQSKSNKHGIFIIDEVNKENIKKIINIVLQHAEVYFSSIDNIINYLDIMRETFLYDIQK